MYNIEQKDFNDFDEIEKIVELCNFEDKINLLANN